MWKVRYPLHTPPLASLSVSALLERGLVACVPDAKLQGGPLVYVQRGGEGSPEEILPDIACAKLLCSLSSRTTLLYPACNLASTSLTDLSLTAEVDSMLSMVATLHTASTLNPKHLGSINGHLQLKTFLCGYHLTLADLALYGQLRRLSPDTNQDKKAGGDPTTAGAPPPAWKEKFVHVFRWYSFLHGQQAIANCIGTALRKAGSGACGSAASSGGGKTSQKGGSVENDKKTGEDKKDSGSKQASYEGKLEGAVDGKVVTRFPPEPSGYLHIGHAKAALLNHYFAKKYHGKMLFRFDDTNPAKENEEFETSIVQDTKLLNVDWASLSHTSDYFEKMQEMCERLIKEGKFYVDDTPTEVMREQRGEGIESCRRNVPIEENLQRWAEMLKGTPEGQKCCVRAKIDMQSKNKCMRDPVMYRCVVDIPHHRHGTKYKAYPTYDFACPVVDSIEGVTHALRTNEYADRIPQYRWVQEAAGLAPTHIYEFSRLCFVKTLLSKRKLKYFVDNGYVNGWDDPRMPTVRGILRRGLQVEALLEFILEQGPSKAGNLMEWDKLWTKNKQLIDPIVPRYMAVGIRYKWNGVWNVSSSHVSSEDAVLVRIKGAPEVPETKKRRMHNKNDSLGEGDMWLLNSILIDKDDAALCEDGEEVTLMHWGNCIFDKIKKNANGEVEEIEATLHLEGDFRKTKKKLHWLANFKGLPSSPTKAAEVIIREYDHLITADKIDQEESDWEKFINPVTQYDTLALGDPLLMKVKEGDLLQLERRGYFRVDEAGDKIVLIKIPDGRSKAMSAVSTKVDAAKLSGVKITGKK
ncbi:glutamate-trna ligase [Cystoisospora suis]|uniref:glutamate--tRNA ligase n=1 Tax=Cystoisospora suis TaxID=483139 RepID=A0A2C6L848_9APIC|nr:glutamate-trna ligase [Cystoisospora suis]